MKTCQGSVTFGGIACDFDIGDRLWKRMEETQLLKPCVLQQAVSSMVIKGQELLTFFDLFLVSDDGRLVCQQHPC